MSFGLKEYLNGLVGTPDWVSKVTATTLRADAMAGMTGATLVLPQGIAFAAIAGLPPEYGFYTAMVTPVVAAITGSSWHAVSGPTTAISALVFGALAGSYAPGSAEFISAAIVLALLVGLIQLALGLARLGMLVDFVSHSVMVGFITGAAILIAFSQLDSALGLDLPRPETLVEFVVELWRGLPNIEWGALLVTLVALATSLAVRWWRPTWPNYLIGLALATLFALLLGGAGGEIATIGSIDSVLPAPVLPGLTLDTLRTLSSPAVAIALVGLLEAMSVSRAIAQKSGQMVNANREFVGQGLSNAVGSFFQCYPGSASFTRSGVNYDAGAATPMSAMFSAVFLFLILLLVAPWFAYVPIPAMAGVIILVAWRLVDLREIRHILRTSTSETAIAVVTFGASLLVDLEFAIYAGVLLSLGLFLNQTARPFVGVGAPDPSSPSRMFRSATAANLPECPQVVVARLDGPLYFGSVEHIRRLFRRFEIDRAGQKHMIFIVKGVGEIDMPGADLLIEEAQRRHDRGGSFHLQTRTPKTLSKLARFKVMRSLTKEHIHLSKQQAIVEVLPLLDPGICRNCSVRIFLECADRPGGASCRESTAQDASAE